MDQRDIIDKKKKKKETYNDIIILQDVFIPDVLDNFFLFLLRVKRKIIKPSWNSLKNNVNKYRVKVKERELVPNRIIMYHHIEMKRSSEIILLRKKKKKLNSGLCFSCIILSYTRVKKIDYEWEVVI